MSYIDKLKALVNETIRRKNIYREALEKIRDTAKSWEGRIDDAPFWDLGDIATAALDAAKQPDEPETEYKCVCYQHTVNAGGHYEWCPVHGSGRKYVKTTTKMEG